MAYLQNPLAFEVKESVKKITPRQIEIIHQSAKLLTENGASGLTIKNIAKAMNFSEAAIYRHFASKEKIIVATLDLIAFQMNQTLSDGDKDENSIQRYDLFFRSLFHYFTKNKNFVTVLFSEGIFDPTDNIKEAFKGNYSILQKYLIPIIMAGKLSKTFPMDVNSEKIVHIVLGTFRFHMSKWLESNFKTDLEKTGLDLMNTTLKLFDSSK